MKTLSTLLVAFLFVSSGYGQTISNEVVSSAGETQSNSTVQVDFSIGESAIETIANSSNTLTQGFHQTQFLYIDLNQIEDSIKVVSYPNPVINELNIEILDNSEIFDLHIYSMDGKIIESHTIQHSLIIDFSKYTGGTYLITIKKNNLIITSYKIIKS